MSNEICGVNEGGRECNQPAVALVSQQTHASKGQPAKTIDTYMCEKHAKQVETTSGSTTVTPV
jgi:hypothetical protein